MVGNSSEYRSDLRKYIEANRELEHAIRYPHGPHPRSTRTRVRPEGISTFIWSVLINDVRPLRRRTLRKPPTTEQATQQCERPAPKQGGRACSSVPERTTGVSAAGEKAQCDKDMQLPFPIGLLKPGQVRRFPGPRKGLTHKGIVRSNRALRFQNARYHSPTGAANAAAGTSNNEGRQREGCTRTRRFPVNVVTPRIRGVPYGVHSPVREPDRFAQPSDKFVTALYLPRGTAGARP